MPLTGYHQERGNKLEKAFWGRCNIEKAAAYASYTRGSKMQILMHGLKYRGVKEIGVYMGRVYANILMGAGFFDDIDYIIPVPLHPLRERKRGFNQSLLISKGLSEVSGKRIIQDLLVRKLNTSTQTRKSRVERWENVANIFKLIDPGQLDGKHILLVDDVITTGSTIEACTNELKSNDSVKVSVIALASAV